MHHVVKFHIRFNFHISMYITIAALWSTLEIPTDIFNSPWVCTPTHSSKFRLVKTLIFLLVTIYMLGSRSTPMLKFACLSKAVWQLHPGTSGIHHGPSLKRGKNPCLGFLCIFRMETSTSHCLVNKLLIYTDNRLLPRENQLVKV